MNIIQIKKAIYYNKKDGLLLEICGTNQIKQNMKIYNNMANECMANTNSFDLFDLFPYVHIIHDHLLEL